MKANYHTHTTRCQHAFGEDREYVEEAIRAGLRILGFSDHCPWIYKSDYVSNIRMVIFHHLKSFAGNMKKILIFLSDLNPNICRN